MPREDFGDADLTHPWAIRWRIPVIPHWCGPTWFYEVALVVPEPEMSLDFLIRKPIWPTEEEAAAVAATIDYRMTYYREGWAARMRQRALDVDSTTNTLVLGKTDQGWQFKRRTWTGGWSQVVYATLGELLDHVFGYPSWFEWTAGHADVYALVGAAL